MKGLYFILAGVAAVALGIFMIRNQKQINSEMEKVRAARLKKTDTTNGEEIPTETGV